MLKQLVIALAAAFSFSTLISKALAQDSPYIAVGTAKPKKAVIALAPIQADPAARADAKTLVDTVAADLKFMDLFRFLEPAAFIETPGAGIAPGTFKFSDWTTVGAEFLAKTSLSRADGRLRLEGALYDTFGSKLLFLKPYVASTEDIKALAHTFANDIVKALTGLPGIFQTKIAMSCDGGRRKGNKEIYMMNFDGSEARQITRHNSISFAPAWHPDGTRLAYSVYARHSDNTKNIDLYELDFATRAVRLISNKKGINSGAAYSPDGSTIAATLSFSGNPEIYVVERGGNAKRLTSSFGFDVDPTWSPDGSKLAFVSSRSGMPMIYSMSSDGSQVRRLTYAGRYNATPSWSPSNNKIAFAGWIDGRFDLFIMNPDGTAIERLTKDQGNNEDPSFSPDGNFIVFSSNRTGTSNIYVVNVDGTFTKRLTYGLGNCVAPKWSNPPR
jgi:TolB protein